jgi:hypothetical protein
MSDKIIRFDMQECVTNQLACNGLSRVYDAGESATFTKELEYLQAGAVEAKFPELKGLQLVPVVGGGIFPGARTHRWLEVKAFGEAELLDTMAPEDFPSAEANGTENTGVFRSIGAKYIVSIEDLRAKPSMTIDVEAQKGRAVRKSMESLIDKIVFGGAATTIGPFKGLLHDTNSQDDTVAAGTPDWETGVEATDAATVIKTFRAVRDAAFAATGGTFEDYDFVVSTKMKLKLGLFLAATTVGGGTTVQDFLLKYVPGVRSISFSARLDVAGAGGKDRMLAFPRDPEVLDFLIPTRFEQWAPQLSGMAFTTYCAAKVGGLRIKHPKAIRRCDVTVT